MICILIVTLLACVEGSEKINNQENFKMKQISNQEPQNLLSKKIFFGHMSVGYNITEGINDLIEEDPRLSALNIYEITESIHISESGFYHGRNGKNGYPLSKCDAFRKFLLHKNNGATLDIALFKFCYVDFNDNSDVDGIFQYYEHTIDDIKKSFPQLKIIHVTVPLMAHNYTLKSAIKNIVKGDIANINRNRFNQLLLRKYIHSDWMYDLAKVESTYPDGSRECFTAKGEKYYSLIKEYTYDSGHLNDVGRRVAAKELINTLISASKTPL
jgi:hypothetical protein